MTPRVLLDVDGVIADFVGAFRERAEYVCGRDMPEVVDDWDIARSFELTDTERDAVYSSMSEPGVASTLQVLPGAVAGVVELACFADVYFVTSPLWSSPTWCHDRERWLKDLFGNDLGGKVIHTRHKHLIGGDLFVDDKPSNVMAWAGAHQIERAFLWDAPYNRMVHLRRLFGWGDLVTRAYQIEEGRTP